MTSHVVVILVTHAVSCVVLFSSCCVGFVAVYLFYVYICSLLVMVYLCSVYFVLSCCGCSFWCAGCSVFYVVFFFFFNN